MSSLSEILTAWRTTMGSKLPGLACYDYVPNTPNLPCLVLIVNYIDFNVTMGRGTDEINTSLYVLVSPADTEISQKELYPYIDGNSSRSIRRTVFENRRLGLTDVDCNVRSMNSFGGKFESGGFNHIGVRFDMSIFTRGVG